MTFNALRQILNDVLKRGSRLPIIDEPGECIEHQADEKTFGLLPMLSSSERQIKERAL